jgi:hypothetical protein
MHRAAGVPFVTTGTSQQLLFVLRVDLARCQPCHEIVLGLSKDRCPIRLIASIDAMMLAIEP